MVRSVVLVLCGVLLACLAGEALIRVGTANQENYVIEMWRYARLLKEPSPDPDVGHRHRPGQSVRLQGVDIEINALGMRGPMPDPRIPPDRTVVILGDSMALGWGVPEEDSLPARLDTALGQDVQVLNAGIGDMTLSQVVALWSHTREKVDARTLVVLATERFSAPPSPANNNWLVENSQLAAVIVTFARQFGGGDVGREALTDAYRRAWNDAAGVARLSAGLDRLKAMEADRGTHIIVALIPSLRDMNNYDMSFMTDRMAAESARHGWPFVDFLPLFQGEPSADFWVSEQDLHPNAEAFRRMASALVPVVREAMGSNSVSRR